MIKNNDRWDEVDILGIVEYCIASGLSASMTIQSKELFNDWIISILEKYPNEGTVCFVVVAFDV